MKRGDISQIWSLVITTVLSLLLSTTSHVLAQTAGDEWDILIQEAKEHYPAGQHDRAEVVVEKALELADEDVERGHPNVATSLDNLATVYLNQAQYAQAKPLLKHALAIRTKALGPDHPDVAGSLNTLAVLDYIQGQYQQAEAALKRSLAIWEKAFGPDHPNIARTLQLLADLYRATNRDEEAETMQQRAASILQGPAESFMESMISKLAPGKEREALVQGLQSGTIQPLQMYDYGAVICSALESGSSKEQILDESYYHFWGVAVSDAMYEAAIEVLCPELSATSPDKLQQ